MMIMMFACVICSKTKTAESIFLRTLHNVNFHGRICGQGAKVTRSYAKLGMMGMRLDRVLLVQYTVIQIVTSAKEVIISSTLVS